MPSKSVPLGSADSAQDGHPLGQLLLQQVPLGIGLEVEAALTARWAPPKGGRQQSRAASALPAAPVQTRLLGTPRQVHSKGTASVATMMTIGWESPSAGRGGGW